MSVKRPAATFTVMVPGTPGVGVTTSVACGPSTRVNAPAVPPATVMSVASKLTPTSSLKTKVKVTGPVAAGAETLLAMATVGAVVSGPAGGAPTGGGRRFGIAAAATGERGAGQQEGDQGLEGVRVRHVLSLQAALCGPDS